MVNVTDAGTRRWSAVAVRPESASPNGAERLAHVLDAGLEAFLRCGGQGFGWGTLLTGYFQISQCIDKGLEIAGSRGPGAFLATVAVVAASGAAWGLAAGLFGGGDALFGAIRATAPRARACGSSRPSRSPDRHTLALGAVAERLPR